MVQASAMYCTVSNTPAHVPCTQALQVLRAVRELHGVLTAPPPPTAGGRRSSLQSAGGSTASDGLPFGQRPSMASGGSSRRTTQQQAAAFESVPSTPGAGPDRPVFVADVVDR